MIGWFGGLMDLVGLVGLAGGLGFLNGLILRLMRDDFGSRAFYALTHTLDHGNRCWALAGLLGTRGGPPSINRQFGAEIA